LLTRLHLAGRSRFNVESLETSSSITSSPIGGAFLEVLHEHQHGGMAAFEVELCQLLRPGHELCVREFVILKGQAEAVDELFWGWVGAELGVTLEALSGENVL
jgi:hypothetical protein